ncbi:MAG: SGNH/GDSL hydrolase family protein [Thermoanaerobaculia bacterium]
MSAPLFERYVAIGDSSTEGIDDRDPDGSYRGWANRLAGRIAESPRDRAPLLYANLGVRGKTTREIRDEQLAPALAMRPDLVTLFCGTNDVVSRRCDLSAVARDLEEMFRALVASGATVLTFTLPDLVPVLPLARRIAPRLETLRASVLEIAARTGVRCVDFAAYPVASDPRLWSADRLHANSAGHERMAAALAAALELPGAGDDWSSPLPPRASQSRFKVAHEELRWTAQFLLPWLMRHLFGKSATAGRRAKRPQLSPFRIDR